MLRSVFRLAWNIIVAGFIAAALLYLFPDVFHVPLAY